MNIPQIIHQTVPNDRKDWHPIWEECQKSWLINHKDFEYVLWNDDDIRNLIATNYSNYLKFYDSLPLKIIQIDFARFFILHAYGGIYADMDFFCYKNFYSFLEHDLYLVESWDDWGEKVQNSLMLSSKNNIFWEKCISISRENIEKHGIRNGNDGVLECCGPKFLSSILDSTVNILPKEFFNPKVESQFNFVRDYDTDTEEYRNTLNEFHFLNQTNQTIITRHYLTGNWYYA